MHNLDEKKILEKLAKLKPIIPLLFLTFFLVLFVGQMLFIYLKFIPTALEPYKLLSPEIHAHVKGALEKVVDLFLIWPIMLFSSLIATILNFRVIQKLINYVKKTERLG